MKARFLGPRRRLLLEVGDLFFGADVPAKDEKVRLIEEDEDRLVKSRRWIQSQDGSWVVEIKLS